MARTYKRDSRGRFASGGGGSRPSRPSGPASPAKSRAKGSKPAKVRGSLPARRKVAAAKGKLAAMDAADQSISAVNRRRGLKGSVTKARKALAAAKQAGTKRLAAMTVQGRIRPGRKRPPTVLTPEVMPPAGGARGGRVPASQRPGSITNTLRSTLRQLAQADAQRIREIEAITGQPVKAPARGGTEAGNRVRQAARGGKAADTLRAGLRELAQSDARAAREMARIVDAATPKLSGGKGRRAIAPAPGQPKRKRKPKPKG